MKLGKKTILMALCLALVISASAFGTIAYLVSESSVTNVFTVGQIDITLDEMDTEDNGSGIPVDENGARIPFTGELGDAFDYLRDNAARTQANDYYLMPGQDYIKDPTITIADKSADSYVRALIKITAYDALDIDDGTNGEGFVDVVTDGDEMNGYNNESNRKDEADYKFAPLVFIHLYDNSQYNPTRPDHYWEYQDQPIFDTDDAGNKVMTVEARARFTEEGEILDYVPASFTAGGENKLPELFRLISVNDLANKDDMMKFANFKIEVTGQAMQRTGFETDEDGAWENFDHQMQTRPNEPNPDPDNGNNEPGGEEEPNNP